MPSCPRCKGLGHDKYQSTCAACSGKGYLSDGGFRSELEDQVALPGMISLLVSSYIGSFTVATFLGSRIAAMARVATFNLPFMNVGRAYLVWVVVSGIPFGGLLAAIVAKVSVFVGVHTSPSATRLVAWIMAAILSLMALFLYFVTVVTTVDVFSPPGGQ